MELKSLVVNKPKSSHIGRENIMRLFRNMERTVCSFVSKLFIKLLFIFLVSSIGAAEKEGSHCLVAGVHIGFMKAIRAQVDDPNTFEHLLTTIGKDHNEGNYVIVMTYSYGNLEIGKALGRIDLSDCSFTIELVNF